MREMFKANQREVIAIAVLVVLLVFYLQTHPKGLDTYVLTIWANQCLILALAAIAQFFVVIVRGIDLSVGAMMTLTNTVASYLLTGSGFAIGLGIVVVLLVGTAFASHARWTN